MIEKGPYGVKRGLGAKMGMATAVSEEDVHNVVTEELIRHGIEVITGLSVT